MFSLRVGIASGHLNDRYRLGIAMDFNQELNVTFHKTVVCKG